MNVPPFYVLCLSSRFDFRMFHDFLVIRNQNEFARRVNAAMAHSVHAKPEMDKVHYFDPYQDPYEHLIAGFSKDFKYKYG
jgi:hypothetical protein